jgi:hypothetical protein
MLELCRTELIIQLTALKVVLAMRLELVCKPVTVVVAVLLVVAVAAAVCARSSSVSGSRHISISKMRLLEL